MKPDNIFNEENLIDRKVDFKNGFIYERYRNNNKIKSYGKPVKFNLDCSETFTGKKLLQYDLHFGNIITRIKAKIKLYFYKDVKNHDRCSLKEKCTPLNLSGTCYDRCKYFK